MAFTAVTKPHRTTTLVPVLFTVTIFLSASLLFFVQPLFTKIVLPHIGGAAAVWTTAMLFFQTTLIAGYVYAHVLTRTLSVKAQIAVHLALWALALTFLPLAVAEGWRYDPQGSTAWQTLVLFAMGVGLPFAVLSANAPLIQSWYAQTGGPSAEDPYFLYGASNLGSLIALLAFPLAAEPLFGANGIGLGWSWGFVALGAALLASGWAARHGSSTASHGTADAAPGKLQMLRWLVLAFVPSSLMLAVTSKISTDVGSIPLVWVIPLSLYLLTFVLTFTNRPILQGPVLRTMAVLGLAYLTVVFAGLMGRHLPMSTIGILVLAFFAVALFVHRSLYEARPSGQHLTIFYVIMSIGGALGGVFNSIIAPSLFNGYHEGAVTVGVAALAFVAIWNRRTPHRALPGLIVGASVLVLLLCKPILMDWVGVSSVFALTMLITVCALLILRQNGAAVAAGVVSVMVVGFVSDRSDAAFRDRSFFGAHDVQDLDGLRYYSNGTTIHGVQWQADLDAERPRPLYYYHAKGPMGQVMTSQTGRTARSIGVVGLGVGSLACYRQPGQDWHFFEIDKMVDDVARNPELFTFMSACAGDAPTHLGDARMVLDQKEDLTFDILIIDAYSSDAVPVHLTTDEAMALYLDRLSPNGLLLYHISNRYYAIERPLARSAEAHGLRARLQVYSGNVEQDPGNSASTVAAFARTPEALTELDDTGLWNPLPSDGGPIWTDDYANVLSILK